MEQLNGQWKSNSYCPAIRDAQQNLLKISKNFSVPVDDEFFAHHVPRSKNTQADFLANQALDTGNHHKWLQEGLQRLFTELDKGVDCSCFIQGRFDGACRQGDKRSSIGVSLELALPPPTAIPLLELSQEVHHKDSYDAEMLAAMYLTQECVCNSTPKLQ